MSAERTPWGDIASRRRRFVRQAPILDETDTALVRYFRTRRRWFPLWLALAAFLLFAIIVGLGKLG